MVISEQDSVRQTATERYGEIARGTESGCGCGEGGGCCPPHATPSENTATVEVAGHENAPEHLDYSPVDLANVPDGSDLGLGCGNPGAIVALRPGEVVLDLGSGGGLDCFLASSQVDPSGQVIGVDMPPDMVAKARRNAAVGGFENVEFRIGEIEHLPVADESVDAIISNCVVNRSPGKRAVYTEVLRVLRPGGRLAILDIVATVELPDDARADMELLTGCVSGASMIGELQETLAELGFANITVQTSAQSEAFIDEWVTGGNVQDYAESANIEAVKPA